jgi:hypothetical protein
LLCASRYDQFWSKFHGLPRRMFIVLMLEEIFCRHVRSIWSMVWFSSRISLFFVVVVVWMTYWWWGGYLSLPLPLCCSLYVLLSPLEYVWWNWVHWCWVHIGW